MITLNLYTVGVTDTSRECLLTVLSNFGDNDFSGENGPEYLWPRVWNENGFKDYEEWQSKGEPDLRYESNQQYALDLVKDIEDDMECIETFFREWLECDSYYTAYKWDVVETDGKIVSISLATVIR